MHYTHFSALFKIKLAKKIKIVWCSRPDIRNILVASHTPVDPAINSSICLITSQLGCLQMLSWREIVVVSCRSEGLYGNKQHNVVTTTHKAQFASSYTDHATKLYTFFL